MNNLDTFTENEFKEALRFNMFDYYSKEVDLQKIMHNLNSRFKKLGNREWCKESLNNFANKNLTPEDITDKKIWIPQKGCIFIGIRFNNLERGKLVDEKLHTPFIEVIPTFPLKEPPADIDLIQKALYEQYKIFDPKQMQISLVHDVAKELFHLNLEVDQYVVVGTKDEICNFLPPKEDFYLEVIKERDKIFSIYHALYVEFCRHHPSLATEVQKISTDYIDEASELGLCLGLFTREKDCIGMLIASKNPLNSLPGIQIVAEHITVARQGKGLARFMQSSLVSQLKPGEIIWGEISGKNIPSLNTALNCGRRVLCTKYFIRYKE